MEALIPVANKLQDIFNTIGQDNAIDLPQIVVLGARGSGKSSLIDALIGRSFFTSGPSIPTLVPVVIQVYNTSGQASIPGTTPTGESTAAVAAAAAAAASDRFQKDSSTTSDDKNNASVGDEWVEFQGKRVEDVRELTDHLASFDRSMGDSIKVKIFSPRLLTLSLVDLPPVEDDETACIEYCTNPNAVLLVTVEANTDAFQSQALHVARQVDPDFSRTLGILTKMDLAPQQSEEILGLLSGDDSPLRAGFLGVYSRSDVDLANEMSIEDSLNREREYFVNHPGYQSVRGQVGVSNGLSRTLTSMFLRHITDGVPDIKVQVSVQLHAVDGDLTRYGETPVVGQSRTEKASVLLRLISKYAKMFSEAIQGHGEDVDVSNIGGGARIRSLFNHSFAQALDNISPFQDLKDAEILTAMTNATGARNNLFVSEISFEQLVRKQIHLFSLPSMQCVDAVYDELRNVAYQCASGELSRFTVLNEAVMKTVTDMLTADLKPTREMVSNIVQMEQGYINTSNPEFNAAVKAAGSGGGGNNGRSVGRDPPQPPSSRRGFVNSDGINTGGGGGHGDDDDDAESVMPDSASVLAAATSAGQPSKSSAFEESAQGFRSAVTSAVAAGAGDAGDNGASGGNEASFMSMIYGGGANTNTSGGPAAAAAAAAGGRGPRPTSATPSVVGASGREPLPTPMTPKQADEMKIVKELMSSYMGVTRKTIRNMVPKTIMYFLVNKVRHNIQSELVSKLYSDNNLDLMLEEDPAITARRVELKEFRSSLKRAEVALDQVRGFRLPASPVSPLDYTNYN